MNEFDIKAAGWDLNPMHTERSKAVTAELTRRITLNREMKVLEFGAGTGITSFMLRDYVGSITMIDSSPEMVKQIEGKIKSSGASNMKAVLFDLENNIWHGEKFNLIVSQMVMHHVKKTVDVLNKFRDMLIPGAYLAIADLYPEDGSFHGDGFDGHKGFDPDELGKVLSDAGFGCIEHSRCFTISKGDPGSAVKQFDVFLLSACLPH